LATSSNPDFNTLNLNYSPEGETVEVNAVNAVNGVNASGQPARGGANFSLR